MRTITIVYQRHPYVYRWLKPMMANRKEFKRLGYKVEYQGIMDFTPPINHKVMPAMERRAIRDACRGKRDIVMMAFHHSTAWLCQTSQDVRISIIKEIKSRCNLLVWLDTADSTGTCMFDVLPYIDLYFKKQLLTDLNLYSSTSYYGSRIFCDYYHKLLKIDDTEITKREYPLAETRDLCKLRLSWNVGLGDLYVSNLYMYLHPFSVKKPEFTSPDTDRQLDVQYRGSGYSPVAGYPRQRSKELLMEMDNIEVCDVNHRIPKDEFVKEGKNAKCILSPFGWGEICGRDFEAITYGACMIKQDMSHCRTYPDIYQPMKTYVPLRWDFSDFKEKLSLAASEEYKQIARNAQEQYQFYFTEAGRMDFAKHIVEELEK